MLKKVTEKLGRMLGKGIHNSKSRTKGNKTVEWNKDVRIARERLWMHKERQRLIIEWVPIEQKAKGKLLREILKK